MSLTLSLPNVAKGKFRPNVQISFCKILKNKEHHVKEQAESFFWMVTSQDFFHRLKSYSHLQNSIKHSGSERVNYILRVVICDVIVRHSWMQYCLSSDILNYIYVIYITSRIQRICKQLWNPAALLYDLACQWRNRREPVRETSKVYFQDSTPNVKWLFLPPKQMENKGDFGFLSHILFMFCFQVFRFLGWRKVMRVEITTVG